MIYKVLDRENLTVGSSVKQLTSSKLTDKVIYARIQVQEEQIRVTEDGTDPNPSTPVGEIYSPLDIFEVWGLDALRDFKMVREGTADARVEVTYLGVGG